MTNSALKIGKLKILTTITIIIILIIACTIIIAIDLSWLYIFGALLLIAKYLFFKKSNANERKKYLLFTYNIILGALIFVALLKSFVFDIYYIPSYSMEATIQKGDVILAKKIYQAKRERSNSFQKAFGNDNQGKESSIRSRSRTSVERNDIVIFNGDNKNQFPLIKRCVGLPGETIFIDSSRVYVEDEFVRSPKNSIQLYQLESSVFEDFKEAITAFSSYHFKRGDSVLFTLQNSLEDSILEVNSDLLANKYLESIALIQGDDNFKTNGLWSIDFFGPIRIPAKGMQIDLDSINVQRYGQTIENFEGVELEWKNNSAFIDGEAISHYVFKNDYYFVLGDNRHSSKDSRFIGFIPKDQILGKTQRVLISIKDGRINWSRLLLEID